MPNLAQEIERQAQSDPLSILHRAAGSLFSSPAHGRQEPQDPMSFRRAVLDRHINKAPFEMAELFRRPFVQDTLLSMGTPVELGPIHSDDVRKSDIRGFYRDPGIIRIHPRLTGTQRFDQTLTHEFGHLLEMGRDPEFLGVLENLPPLDNDQLQHIILNKAPRVYEGDIDNNFLWYEAWDQQHDYHERIARLFDVSMRSVRERWDERQISEAETIFPGLSQIREFIQRKVGGESAEP